MWAFATKILGGLSFAFIYLYYYGGGDTLSYYSDSVVITEILIKNPIEGLSFIFSGQTFSIYKFPEYMSRIGFKTDSASLSVCKIGAIFNLITFDSYLSDTILFSLFGFFGSWKLFMTLSRLYPTVIKQLAIGCLFIPSVIFWGSGMMKDTLCVALLCYIFSFLIEIIFFGNRNPIKFILFIFFSYLLIYIKIYIFLCFIFPIFLLIFIRFTNKVKNVVIRVFLFYPILIALSIFVSYVVIDNVGEMNQNYSLEKIEETAKTTSSYIGRMSIQSDGSYYDIGNLDFTLPNLPSLLFNAFVVTFYRPYVWQIKNPLMLLSTVESFFFIYLTYKLLIFLYKRKDKFYSPFVIFCFVFSITFAFVVGVTSSNFGTLARYKIPTLPFFVCGIYVFINQAKSAYKGV